MQNFSFTVHCASVLTKYSLVFHYSGPSTDNLSLHTFSIGNPNLLCFEIDSVPQFCHEKNRLESIGFEIESWERLAVSLS